MPPLKVEYAKSSRSRCILKECSKFIEKGEVRIGTGMLMPGMDDPSFKWRHLCCFTARQLKNVASVDNIDGFADLLAEDQALVTAMVQGKLVGVHSLIGQKGKKEDGNCDEKGASPKEEKKKVEGKKKKKAVGQKGKRAEDDGSSDATDEYVVELHDTVKQCPYGVNCFRKNPEHFLEYAHRDSGSGKNVAVPVVVGKKKKVEGTLHVTQPVVLSPPKVVQKPSTDSSAQKVCPFGAMCFRTDDKHFVEFAH